MTRSQVKSSLSVIVLSRKYLGPELVIVILTMSRENIKKRLQKRHPKKEDKETIDWMMVTLLLLSC